jgi:2-(1,2-epoxy-1,2-dihydrophenyl)acetyl-CoA isomerase
MSKDVPASPATNEEEQEALLIGTQDGVRILTLNRPRRLNALTPELHQMLREALASAAADTSVGAVVLTGAGRAFCSGGDVSRGAEQAKSPETVEERADLSRLAATSALLLNRMPKPTIALINGAAVGAGLSLALACDLRFASRDAVLRTAYARIALSGDLGISYFLTRLVGPARARELMFLNDKLSGEDALRIGLINRLFDSDEFQSTALEIVRSVAHGPGIALRYMKQNLLLAETASLEQVIEREAYNMARCVRTQDAKEASIAFREKRTPDFRRR